MADPNTRQGKRTPVTLKIKFKSETLEQFIERYAVDVSQGGIFIRTKEPLAVGTQMRFEFQLRDASPLIAGDGTVVWTRENDPSRPAIAPGMGVRFDRLADGSQTVLERILSEKAKQAPQRVHGEPTKPPLFTDTPTRVAPAPVQDALLGGDSKRNRAEEHTPLPKPMPFHSDADEFPDEAFEEATKVRALDDLIAQTAGEGEAAQSGELFSGKPPDELAARRGSGNRMDSTLADPPTKEQIAATAQHLDNAGTSPGFASGRSVPERESAPGLPSPPEIGSAPAKAPRLLDTSPSPRTEEGADAKAALIAQNARMEKLAKTRIGMEPANAATRSASTSTPPASVPVVPQPSLPPTRPSGHAIEAARTSGQQSAQQSAVKPSGSKAPLIILLLVLLAGGGAAVWFFFLREKAVEKNGGGNVVVKDGSNKNDPPKGSNDGSAKQPDGSAGAGTGSAPIVEPPKGPLVDIEIASTTPKAEIEVVGTTFKGPSPLKAKLEKDKAYKVRVSAPGHATLEQDVKGGQDKITAKLDPKPHVITVASEPAGALIFIDGIPAGHVTPHDIELTKVQAARRAVRVGLRKGGFKPVEKLVEIGSFKEDPSKMMASIDEKLVVQQVVIRPPPTGSGSAGSATPPTGSGSDGGGSAAPPPTGSGTPPPTGSGTPNTGGGSGGTSGGGSAKEPEPEFVKPNP